MSCRASKFLESVESDEGVYLYCDLEDVHELHYDRFYDVLFPSEESDRSSAVTSNPVKPVNEYART